MLNKKKFRLCGRYSIFAKEKRQRHYNRRANYSKHSRKYKLNATQVDVILHQLEYDGYFECTKSDRDGKTVNVITLKQKEKRSNANLYNADAN